MNIDDTAQPSAAETEPTREETLLAAAAAFKNFVPDEDQPATKRARNERGQFASTADEEEAPAAAAEEEEIEAEGEESLEGDEGDEEQDDGEEADEESQPTAAAMPTSWSKDDEQLWNALPPEVQGKIAEREGQRDAAVNQKFQESANARRVAEAQIAEANANRAQFAAALDQVMHLVQPQWPSPTMLDVNSDDYDPDAYHIRRAEAEADQLLIQQLTSQRQAVAAQAMQEEALREQQAALAINQATLPAFEAAFPEVKDPETARPFLAGLMQYAAEQGAPPEFFNGTITAVEWHIIAKAKKWDDHQKALAKVRSGKPEPRKAQPAIRPGVVTSKSGIQNAKLQKAKARLASEHSLEAGADVIRQMMKGQKL